jgi:hypothetical protein
MYQSMYRADGYFRANLATSGYSVFLMEAGGDNSTQYLQEIPALLASPTNSHLCADI